MCRLANKKIGGHWLQITKVSTSPKCPNQNIKTRIVKSQVFAQILVCLSVCLSACAGFTRNLAHIFKAQVK